MTAAKKAPKESPFQLFNDKWEKDRKGIDLNKDIALQNDELGGVKKDSNQYITDENTQSQTVVNYIYSEMNALKTLMSSSEFKNSATYTKDNYTAQVQLLQLQKDANGLLIDIKNNTAKTGEFNKPSDIRALTYYDYKAQDADKSTLTISDAKFVMQITAPQTLSDAQNIMDLFKKTLADYIKRTDSTGVNNDHLFGN
jgi:hypothetical protein